MSHNGDVLDQVKVIVYTRSLGSNQPAYLSSMSCVSTFSATHHINICSSVSPLREPKFPDKMATKEDVGVWSFGYGSNMDMVALQNKKGVRVLEHCPAILQNFRLTFSTRGLDYVEPGYAGLGKEEGSEVRMNKSWLV